MMGREGSAVTWQIQVESYAGYKGDQQPLYFVLAQERFRVDKILDQWYGPDETYFRVRASDGNFYILRRDFSDIWTLESFRREPKVRECSHE
jgi:hypothetical protein